LQDAATTSRKFAASTSMWRCRRSTCWPEETRSAPPQPGENRSSTREESTAPR
jgi:hypothetical protein